VMKRGIWLLTTSPLLFVCDGFTANLQKIFEPRARDRDAETTPEEMRYCHTRLFRLGWP
jgi:hypothetical protein